MEQAEPTESQLYILAGLKGLPPVDPEVLPAAIPLDRRRCIPPITARRAFSPGVKFLFRRGSAKRNSILPAGGILFFFGNRYVT